MQYYYHFESGETEVTQQGSDTLGINAQIAWILTQDSY